MLNDLARAIWRWTEKKRFASQAWPRPGLAEPRSASIAGFGNTGPLSTEWKGKDWTSRYNGLVLGSFLAPEIDMIFGDGVGASLVAFQVLPTFWTHFAFFLGCKFLVRFHRSIEMTTSEFDQKILLPSWFCHVLIGYFQRMRSSNES